MNPILKYGLAVMFFGLLILLTAAYALEAENIAIGLLTVPLCIGIQYSLPKFVLSILAMFRKKTAEDIVCDIIEKQEQTIKDKEAHDKFFKGQGY